MKKSFTIALLTLLGTSYAHCGKSDDLGSITVTAASSISESLKETTANISIIDSSEIEERGYRTIAEALSHISGFVTSSNGGAGQPTGIFLRGFNSGNILIMLDSIPLKDPSDPSFSSALANISLSDVERIEVVKGAQSGVWGADASAGVVNIVTKEAKEGASAAINLGYGSYDDRKAYLSLSTAGRAGSLFFAASHRKSNGFSALRPSDAEGDKYINDTMDMKAWIDTGAKSRVGIFYHGIESSFDYDGYDTSNNPLPDDKLSNGKFREKLGGLRYEYDGEKTKVSASASFNNIDRELDDISWGASEYHGRSERGALSLSYRPDKNSRFILGAQYKRYSSYDSFSPESSFDNRALIGGYRYIAEDLLGARTIFDISARYDDFSTFDDKATYRVGMKRECKRVPGLFGSLNIYSSYRAPSLYQYSTNNTLEPESTNGYELSIGYEEMLKITYFNNKIENRIDYDYSSWSYFNSGRDYRIDGLELEGRYFIESISTSISANYTHLFSTTDQKGDPILRVPRNCGNLFIDYYYSEDTSIGISMQYMGERVDYGDYRLDEYTTFDINYNRKISENLKLSLKASNIGDEDYETAHGYSTAGRSIYAEVKYRF